MTVLPQCPTCNQPLPTHAWKGGDRRFYCNEFCASDGEAVTPEAMGSSRAAAAAAESRAG
jgi:hypothetical protein